MLGSVFAEVGNCLQENWLNLRPLGFPEPAEELVAIRRGKVTQFPGLALEQIGHGNSGTQFMRKDISALLSRNLKPKYVYTISDINVLWVLLGWSVTIDTDYRDFGVFLPGEVNIKITAYGQINETCREAGGSTDKDAVPGMRSIFPVGL
jgi:hypothetical protein